MFHLTIDIDDPTEVHWIAAIADVVIRGGNSDVFADDLCKALDWLIEQVESYGHQADGGEDLLIELKERVKTVKTTVTNKQV